MQPRAVLAGPKGQRPKVRSLLKDWSSWSRQTLRLAPGQGAYAVYRRLSRHRIGPKAKARTFYVHQERRRVHSVGEVRLVFSAKEKDLKTATPDDVKILMTNDQRLTVRDVIELYSLRWQIELFFKELKLTLGFHQYGFRDFEAVEGWVELALTTFLYLESYRATVRAARLERRGRALVAAAADLRPLPSGPSSERSGGIGVHGRAPGDPRRDTRAETAHSQQLSQGIPDRNVNTAQNSATSKRACRDIVGEPRD